MKQIDAYIAKSAPFARPILEHLRELVHEACPHAEETMKWSMPFFVTHGSNLCHMAAFKAHCAFGFWKGSMLRDPKGILQTGEKAGMGHLGKIASAGDLPDDKTLIAYIREADRLNEMGTGLPKEAAPEKKEREPLVVPALLVAALKKNKAAAKMFEGFSYSARKEYINWINEAKTEATREKRLATAIAQIAEGKPRDWKYKRK